MMRFFDYVNFVYPLSHPSPVIGGRFQRRMGDKKINQINAIIYNSLNNVLITINLLKTIYKAIK
jgi:hypothetical protein